MDFEPEYLEYPEEDEEGIYIEDETVWDEPEYEDVPEEVVPPLPPSPPHQQQILIGYPPAPLTTQSQDSTYFCLLYPDECSGSKLEDVQHGNCSSFANCTNATVGGAMPSLGHVDLSGLGLGVLLVVFLLLAVHLAWDSEGKGSDRKRDDQSTRTGDSKGEDGRPQGSRKSKEGKPPDAAKVQGTQKPRDDSKDRRSERDARRNPSGPEQPDGKSERRTKNPKDGTSDSSRDNQRPSGVKKSDGKSGKRSDGTGDRSRAPEGITPSRSREKDRGTREETPSGERDRGNSGRHRANQDKADIGRTNRDTTADGRVRSDGTGDSRSGLSETPTDRRTTEAKRERDGKVSSGDSKSKDRTSARGSDRETPSRRTGKEEPLSREPSGRDQGARQARSSVEPPKGSDPSKGTTPRGGREGPKSGDGNTTRGKDSSKEGNTGRPSAGPADLGRSKDGARDSSTRSTGPASDSRAPRTAEQKKADTALEVANKRLEDAKKKEEAEKKKAMDKAKAENGGKSPSTPPRTPKMEKAQTERKKAEDETKKAKENKDKADIAAKRTTASGEQGKRSKTEKPDTQPTSTRTSKTSQPATKQPTVSEQEEKNKRRGAHPAGPTEKEEKKRRKEAEAARDKVTPAPPDSRTKEQVDADKNLKDAKAKLKAAQDKSAEAKASGDQAKIDQAKAEQREAGKSYQKAKDRRDKAYGAPSPEVKKAEQDLKKAQAAEQEAKASGDPKKVQEAKDKRRAAEDKRDKVKAADDTKKAKENLQKALVDETAAKASGDADRLKTAQKERNAAQDTYQKAKGAEGAEQGEKGDGWFKWWMLLPLLFLPVLGVLGNRPMIGPNLQARRHSPISPILPPVRKPSGSRWVANESPQININNGNVHGGTVKQEAGEFLPVATPTLEPLIEVEPLNIHLHGPADPDRLIWMLFALGIAALPLILDSARDWPDVNVGDTAYARPLLHWIGAGVCLLCALGVADSQFGWSSRYGVSGVRLDPQILASAVERGESLVWGLEDMVFGDDRHVLGTILAASLPVLVSQRRPMRSAPMTDYAPVLIQILYLGGFHIMAMLFWNA